MALSRFWHRRLCEAIFVLSVAIVILYIVQLFLAHAPYVSLPVLILSILGAGASAATYFFFDKLPANWVSYGVFALFAVAATLLIISTGGVSSPFIALFLLVAFFSGMFSYFGALPLLIATGIYYAAIYIQGGATFTFTMAVLFTSVLPLVAGFIAWYGRGVGDTDERREVKQIANHLSEVASASEVIINAIGDGVAAIDSMGTVQLINPAAQKLLGWSKQDALTLNYKSVLHLLTRQNTEVDPSLDPIQQSLNTNQEVRTNELLLQTKNEKRFMASIVVSPISEQAGSGVIVMFHDITKEKQEEREQAEFISTASHEMRTPVASIEGYLGLALNPQTANIDAKARDFIMKAQQAAQHLGRLFQDLLDVSKADDGRMTNIPKVIDVIPFVGELAQGLTQKATDKGLKLTYKPQSMSVTGQRQLAPVYFTNVDQDHLREVTDNLIENAIKYTPAGEVIVDVSGNEDKVVISIKDSGIGIPAEDIPHLFQKFYRVANEETNQIGGTGLGLYLSRRLAEAMSGRIWVESQYKQGSTFFLELPRIDTATAQKLRVEQANQISAPKAAEQISPDTDDAAAPTPFAPPAPVAAPQMVSAPAPAAPTPAPVAPQAPTTPAIPAMINAPAAPVQAPTAPIAPTSAGINGIAPATSVPRGETLSREQIAAYAARLNAMASEQRGGQGQA